MAIFDKAKTIKTDKPSKRSAPEVVMAGIEAVAALDTVIKSLTALKETKTDEVKEAMKERFIRVGLEEKRRPVNFKGIEGEASASCELRIRSKTSALSDAEVTFLTKHGIKTQKVVSTVETFAINPAYLQDPAVMKAVEAALKKVKGLPEDFIQYQEGQSKTVVDEDALDEMFAKANKAACGELINTIGVLAIKPKMNEDDYKAAMKIVAKIAK